MRRAQLSPNTRFCVLTLKKEKPAFICDSCLAAVKRAGWKFCLEQLEPFSQTPSPVPAYTPAALYEHTVLMHMPFCVFLSGLHLLTFTLSHFLRSLALRSWISPWGPGWRTWSRRPGWFCRWCAWASPHWWYWSCPGAQRSATGPSWLLVSGEMLAKASWENRFSYETDCVPEQTNWRFNDIMLMWRYVNLVSTFALQYELNHCAFCQKKPFTYN